MKLHAIARYVLRPAAVLVLGAASAVDLALPLRAQSPAAQPAPAFEVASVKRNTSASENASFGLRPGGVVAVSNNTLRNIIRNTYGLQNFQIVGGPDWINTEHYDITAKAEGNPLPPEILLMMQSLLADRFKLVVHTEMREAPVYALVVARADGRLGPELRRAAVDCNAIAAAARGRGAPPQFPPQPGNRPACGTRSTAGLIMTTGVTMADVARNLSGPAGRMVVDKTGLAGYWDFDLKYSPDPAGAATAPSAPGDSASLFTALQEQLGLRLEAQRTPVETLVIDSADRPMED